MPRQGRGGGVAPYWGSRGANSGKSSIEKAEIQIKKQINFNVMPRCLGGYGASWGNNVWRRCVCVFGLQLPMSYCKARDTNL